MESNVGKWDKWYVNLKDVPQYYANTITYELGNEFLKDCSIVEDWGTGGGAFKLFRKDAIGVDGSNTPFAEKKYVDLTNYVSECDGIFMRHVLEHNYDWQKILRNAIKSANKKICVVMFIPLNDGDTKELAYNGIGVPDLSISKNEFYLVLQGHENIKYINAEFKTDSQYGYEQIIYIEKYEKNMRHYSQYGQDKLLNSLINKRNGFFIDIGAHDGISFSNSYLFETELEWNGICVEPLPNVFKKLQENRKCTLENCAISDVEGILDFVSIEGYGEMLSGFNREETAKNTILLHGGTYEIIKVNTFRLDTILNKYNIKHADFCSIDTETTELNVIKSIDWNNYQIEYLCVEKNDADQKIIDYLMPYGYEYVTTVEGDIILKKSLKT